MLPARQFVAAELRPLKNAQAAAFLQAAFFLDLEGAALGRLGAGSFAGHGSILLDKYFTSVEGLFYRTIVQVSKAVTGDFPGFNLARMKAAGMLLDEQDGF